jgi:hypothetical protein
MVAAVTHAASCAPEPFDSSSVWVQPESQVMEVNA